MSATAPHLSAYELDSLRLARLAPERARAARDHLASCTSCRRLDDELSGEQRRFLAEVLPRGAPALRARAETTARMAGRRWWMVTVAPLAPALVAVALLMHPKVERRDGQPNTATYQAEKGSGSFSIVARRSGRVFRVAGAGPLRAGDAIRFVVTSSQAYLMIASIDGRGRSKVYVPYDGGESAAVPLDRKLELPENGSIELDAAPGPERIFALFSRQPLSSRVVLAALDRLGRRGPAAVRATERLDIGADTQLSELLEKE
jgi:hypothetical protein